MKDYQHLRPVELEWARAAEAAEIGPWEAGVTVDAGLMFDHEANVFPPLGGFSPVAVVSGDDNKKAGKTAAFIAVSRTAVPALLDEVERLRSVTNQIVAIMHTYDEQEAAGCVDTPGGLEHMGDVWRLLDRWRAALAPQEQKGDRK